MIDVVWFKDVDKNDTAIVGGKGANLGELTKVGAPVPNGFIVTAKAYFEAVASSGALDRIKGILYNLNVEDPAALDTKAHACQEEIKRIELSSDLVKKVVNHYERLSISKNPLVAVRSSATAEDLPEASFAGQQTTFLNISGRKELLDAIRSAWASLFEARAIFYREQQKFDHFKVGIAVPVQIMVQSQTSGVMFTVDPVTNDKNTIVIEAVFGLGELIVTGRITPDHYEVEKKTLKIKSKNIVSQLEQMIRSYRGNEVMPVSKAYRKTQKLPDEKIMELAKLGKKIEEHYFFPQDLEWAYEKGKLFLVQTRPVTTLSKKTAAIPDEKLKSPDAKPIIIGAPASPAVASGRVKIIKSPKELGRVQKGDVLVTVMTNPDYVPAMRRATAIVTDRGGRTSHAAIVSRELGIACVVGTGNATKKLKDGMTVTVDGARGFVYLGAKYAPAKNVAGRYVRKTQETHTRTATKLYVNLGEPDLAAQVAAKNVDGVGLLRAEFMLAQIGTHPKKFIADKKEDDFIENLANGLAVFTKAFGKRPVIYRASDLKSNEYRNLKGGQNFEPHEANPMLGFRGAFRYLKDPDTFKLELEAIKKVRQKHNNLHLMIPFVRSPKELAAVKNIVNESELPKDRLFKFWMMVEIPTNVIALEQFISCGIDGVSIGSNDLTMLILGTDRDNEEIAAEFNEMDPSVLWALEKVVKTCAKYDITSSICGQAPSIYPQLTELLVSWGITSISVNPDAIERTKEVIYQAEQKLVTTRD
ncbi:phosphoenolpyruvate synthase [Candidatus Curtissbacteria bacterium]|nr:phosphoenolpyruvate synthase [Candidatus Curtissbacteria bacterium]